MLQMLLKLSIVGGLITIVLLAIRPLTRKIFSPQWQYYIWFIVLVSMIIPVNIKLPLISAEELITNNKAVQTDADKSAKEITKQPQAETIIHNIPEETEKNLTSTIKTMKISDIAVFIWCFGAAAFLLFNIICYIVYLGRIKKNSYSINDCPELEECRRSMKIKRSIRLRITEKTTSPMLVGVIRPEILIPDINMQSESLIHILLHELTHYKRKDLLYKWFAMLINALHWFNPLIYIVVKNINEDCEISCDAAVTKGMSYESKSSYITTILSLLSYSSTKNQTLTTAMASNKSKIIRRFAMIQTYKKKRKITTMLSVLLTAVIMLVSVSTSSVLANIGKDGLEYWTKAEYYNRNSIKFDLNVTGKSVPQWAKDIADKNGKIEVTLTNMQIRQIDGRVVNELILNLNGKSSMKLGNSEYGAIPDPSPENYEFKNNKLRKASLIYSAVFLEAMSDCEDASIVNILSLSPNSKQNRGVEVDFACTKDGKVSFASVKFIFTNIDRSETDDSLKKYTFLEADKFKFVGGSEEDFWRYFPSWVESIFTDTEKNYENKKVEGINCAVLSSSPENIQLKTKVTVPKIYYYNILVFVYDENDQDVASHNSKSKMEKNIPHKISIKPSKSKMKVNIPQKIIIKPYRDKFLSGKTYRVDIGLLDEIDNVVYRQREYVKIP